MTLVSFLNCTCKAVQSELSYGVVMSVSNSIHTMVSGFFPKMRFDNMTGEQELRTCATMQVDEVKSGVVTLVGQQFKLALRKAGFRVKNSTYVFGVVNCGLSQSAPISEMNLEKSTHI